MRLLWSELMRAACFVMAAAGLVSSVLGQVADLPVFQCFPPERPLHDVWIEGEGFAEQSGFAVMAREDCYGGRQMVLHTAEQGGHWIRYEFEVAEAGTYLLSVAGGPVGEGYCSQIGYAIDDQARREVTALGRSDRAWGHAGCARWTNLAMRAFEAGRHSLTIFVDRPRWGDGTVYAYWIDAVCLLGDPISRLNMPPVVVTDRPANIFAGDEPIVFGLKYPHPAGVWEWMVSDWRGRTSAEGGWRLGEESLRLPALSMGYYRLRIRPEGAAEWQPFVPFARVVDPGERAADPNSPFAMDAGPSWARCPDGRFEPPEKMHEVLAEVARLCGAVMIRERNGWSEEPRGEYHWGETVDRNARLFSERGVQICGMYHNAPGFAINPRRVGFVWDLMAVYRFSRACVEHFGGRMQAWEFMNEPDAWAGPAWDLAAAHKAAYLGFKAGDAKINVLNPSSCFHPVPRFMDTAMENGLGDYFDTYNCHIYEREFENFPKVVADERALLSRYGVGHKPMWVTENGYYGGGAGASVIPGSGLMEHDAEQELSQAEYIVKSQLLFGALGVERDFSFYLPPYQEPGRVWGFLRWDFTVKPVIAAYAAMTWQLNGARYRGRLALGPEVEALLYDGADGTQTLVLWSKDGEDREVEVGSPVSRVALFDFVGRSAAVPVSDGLCRLSVGRYPIYVRGLASLEAVEGPVAVEAAAETVEKDLSVVLRLDLGDEFQYIPNKVLLEDGFVGQATLEVFNFSDTAKRGVIENLGEGYVVDGLPESVDVAAMAKAAIPIGIRFGEDAYGVVKVRLAGRFAGRPTSPVCIPVKLSAAGVDPSLAAREVPWREAERWVANSSGKMGISFDEAEGAVRFEVEFPAGADCWVYPEFPLALPGESLAGAVGLTFEVKAEPLCGFCLVMAVLEDTHEVGERCDFNYRVTSAWSRVHIFFDEDAPASFDPATVKMLRIGGNPSGGHYSYWIRDLKWLFPKSHSATTRTSERL